MRDLACGALAALACVEWEGEGGGNWQGFCPRKARLYGC
jgi:hypothetical protein